MAITIRHLDGPLAGQEQHFDNSVDVIVFGRSPECQVIYPPDYTVVGRMHFLLRRTMSGGYVIELLAERYIEIDGIQAENGSPVTTGSVIRIGSDGPTLITTIDEVASFGLPPTRQREMADIAWSADGAEDADDDVLSRYAFESEGVVDLLVKRKSEPPAVVAGIPADAVQHLEPTTRSAPSPSPVRVGAADRPSSPFDPWFEDLLQGRHQSLPSGVGSGGAPHSHDSVEVAYSDIPANRGPPRCCWTGSDKFRALGAVTPTSRESNRPQPSFNDARSLEPEPNAEPRAVPAPTVVRVAVPAAAIIGIAVPARTTPTPGPAPPPPTPTPPTAAPASRFRRCAGCGGYGGRQTGYADCGSYRRSHRADAPKDRDSYGRDSPG